MVVVITAAEAIVALEAAAGTEEPAEGCDQKAVSALLALCEDRPGPFSPAEIRAVIEESVPSPRQIVHTTVGGIGADWDLADAVSFASELSAVCTWEPSLLGDELVIDNGSRVLRFEVRAPENAQDNAG